MAHQLNMENIIRKEIKNLRNKYAGAISAAHKALHEGAGRIARHERNALETHYQETRKNLYYLRRSEGPANLVNIPLIASQEAVERIILNTRHNFRILGETREQVVNDVRQSLNPRQTDDDATPADSGPTSSTATTQTGDNKKTGTQASGSTKSTSQARSTTRQSGSTARKTSAQRSTSKSSGAASGKTSGTAASASTSNRSSKSSNTSGSKKAGSGSGTGKSSTNRKGTPSGSSSNSTNN